MPSFGILRGPSVARRLRALETGKESLVYRAEVLAIIGALADLVVDVRRIRQLLEDDDEEEAE